MVCSASDSTRSISTSVVIEKRKQGCQKRVNIWLRTPCWLPLLRTVSVGITVLAISLADKNDGNKIERMRAHVETAGRGSAGRPHRKGYHAVLFPTACC